MSSAFNLLSSALNMSFDALRDGQRPIDIAFMFRVITDMGPLGDFQVVEGMQRTIEAFEYQEGGKNNGKHVLYGPVKQGRVTLKSGMMSLAFLYEWSQEVEIGGEFRRDVLIMQLTRAGMPLRIFVLAGAWPVEWKGAPLDATQSQVPIEELHLAYNDLYMVLIPDVI